MKLAACLAAGLALCACGEEAFTFTVTADSHLDERTDRALYRSTLLAAAAEKPAFHVDLGDTFMTEKLPSREAAAAQYQEQRRLFGLLGAAAPRRRPSTSGAAGMPTAPTALRSTGLGGQCPFINCWFRTA
jgi:hypothetical protein